MIPSYQPTPGKPTRAEDIQGWMTATELAWLRHMASRPDINSVVEIGSWKGRSTWALCESCRGPVYAVDTWAGTPSELQTTHAEARLGTIHAQFMANVGHFPNLYPIPCTSTEAAALVPDVDMVFIDGDHSYESVMDDITHWRPKTRVLLAGHDINMPGVYSVVAYMFGELMPSWSVAPGTTIWYVEAAI